MNPSPEYAWHPVNNPRSTHSSPSTPSFIGENHRRLSEATALPPKSELGGTSIGASAWSGSGNTCRLNSRIARVCRSTASVMSRSANSRYIGGPLVASGTWRTTSPRGCRHGAGRELRSDDLPPLAQRGTGGRELPGPFCNECPLAAPRPIGSRPPHRTTDVVHGFAFAVRGLPRFFLAASNTTRAKSTPGNATPRQPPVTGPGDLRVDSTRSSGGLPQSGQAMSYDPGACRRRSTPILRSARTGSIRS